MTSNCLVSSDGAVVTVELRRPERRNALTVEMLETIQRVADRPEGAVVLLTGSDEVFSAGADLSLLENEHAAEMLEDVLAAATDAIAGSPVPWIAAVEGACLGAGVELVAACDVRVVAEDAFFEIPATRLGILYRPDGVARLAHRLGDHAVRRLFLANERMRAAALGSFAGSLVEPGTTRAHARDLCEHAATLTAPSIAATKALLADIERGMVDGPSWEALRRDLRRAALGDG